MLNPSRPAYTADLKLAAVRRIKRGECAAAIAREIGVPESTLRSWKKRFSHILRTTQELELQRLKFENGRLQQKLAAAKKALAHVVRDMGN